MLGWFHALLPKQGRFFELFDAHAATLVAGAEALALLLRGGDDIETHIREIVLREVLAPLGPRVRIVPAQLGSVAGLVGAGLVAFEALDAAA